MIIRVFLAGCASLVFLCTGTTQIPMTTDECQRIQKCKVTSAAREHGVHKLIVIRAVPAEKGKAV